jgi:hypothetical protein
MTAADADHITALLAEQQALIDRQQAELTELRAAVSRINTRIEPNRGATVEHSRRDLLKLAGVAAAGAAGTLVLTAGPAAAANADPLTVGAQAVPDPATTPTSGIDFTGAGEYFGATPHAVFAVTDDVRLNAISAAIVGGTLNNAAIGVVGLGAVYDLFAWGSGVIGFLPALTTGPPTTDQWRKGDLLIDEQGTLFVCVGSGTPGVWRELAGPSSAGAFHAVSPQRVYDSRTGGGPLGDGDERVVSVAGPNPAVPVVPTGATAVSITLTVTGTQGAGGYVAVRPSGTPYAGTSSINWFGPNQNIATTVVSQLGGDRQLTMRGGIQPTEIVVDVTGFYS